MDLLHALGDEVIGTITVENLCHPLVECEALAVRPSGRVGGPQRISLRTWSILELGAEHVPEAATLRLDARAGVMRDEVTNVVGPAGRAQIPRPVEWMESG